MPRSALEFADAQTACALSSHAGRALLRTCAFDNTEAAGPYVRNLRRFVTRTAWRAGDLEHVAAELKNGVLTVTVPKKPEAKTKQVNVKAS